jgi:hypothetical protein
MLPFSTVASWTFAIERVQFVERMSRRRWDAAGSNGLGEGAESVRPGLAAGTSCTM